MTSWLRRRLAVWLTPMRGWLPEFCFTILVGGAFAWIVITRYP